MLYCYVITFSRNYTRTFLLIVDEDYAFLSTHSKEQPESVCRQPANRLANATHRTG